MLIVEETQLVKAAYLVNTDNKEDAIKIAKELGEDAVDITKWPEFIESVEFSCRELTAKEEDDGIVIQAQKMFFQLDESDLPKIIKKDPIKDICNELLKKAKK
jgi:hypothetical protein